MANTSTRLPPARLPQLDFSPHYRRRVRARFTGALMSSDGGGLLLGEVDRVLCVIDRLARCFTDHRNQGSVAHSLRELIAQRVYGIALGYEDLSDHDSLRADPVLAMLVGKKDIAGRGNGGPLASSASLGRLERSRPAEAPVDRYRRIAADLQAMDDLLLQLFLEAHDRAPAEIVLDLDATDDPVHGRKQEGRFYHGYYRGYCYLPLYVYCGQHLLLCRLGTSNRDPGADAPEQVNHLVEGIRKAWPGTRIILRGDSGFCRNRTMDWCERGDVAVDYVFGLARNARLVRILEPEMAIARIDHLQTGEPARRYRDFGYRTLKSWSRTRRVVGKAEYLARGANPRYVVTSLDRRRVPAAGLYEQKYCPRGEMENRIKEMQMALFSDRTSSQTMRANQLRIYFSGFAYVLLSGIRRLAPEGADASRMRCDTLRLKLLKIAAQLRVTSRRIWITLPKSCPAALQIAKILATLRSLPRYRPRPA